MDKQTIIRQLELDINALQRQVEDFKNYSENISSVEWELFVQRLHLMHEYCTKLKLQVQQVATSEVTGQPVMQQPVQQETVLNEPVLQEIDTPVMEDGKTEEVVTSAVVEEIKKESIVVDQQVNVIAHISTAVEKKTATPKGKKQIASVGGLFGDTHSVAENFKDEPSIADTIAKTKSEKSVAHTMQHKPIKDLKDAIGINEKFLFINELFDGNLQDYSEALDKLNASQNLQTAEEFIRAELAIRFNWTDDSAHVKNFRDLVERRFT